MAIKWKLMSVFGVLLLLLVAFGTVVLVDMAEIQKQFSFVVKHDAPVIANANQLLKFIVDMETGQRGFCLTQKEEFLEPYNYANREFSKLLKIEKELVSDNPSQVMAIDKIENLIRKWHQGAAAPEIAKAREVAAGKDINERHKAIQELAALLEEGTGKAIIDEIREEFAKFIKSEEQLTKQRYAAASQTTLQTRKTVLFLIVFSILFGSIIATLTIRSIIRPVGRLLKGTEIIGSGNLGHRIEIKSKDEIGQLSVSFNQMIDKLQQTKYQIGRETTERKQAEEESGKLQVQLRQAQKMEAIGTLAGGIAHDFNNILYPIIGYTEMMLDDAPEGSDRRVSLNEVLKASLRARDLVEQILTFSRQAGKELKPLKTQIIIKEALKLIRASIPSTIAIDQNIDKDCGMVLADPTHIHQIAMNLVTNAFHAMEEDGGTLTIALSEVNITAEDSKNIDLNPGTFVCFSVSDTGHGIEKLILDRIFEPYFTTKNPGKGTGLGLSVVHGIAKSYKGDIRVYSEPGKGTVFKVYLPAIDSKTENAKPIMGHLAVHGEGEHILLVDDEEPILKMEKQILESLGYRVTSRTSSTEALEAFRSSSDRFDLVITDMTMPNMTGEKLAFELKNIRKEFPVILCTGFSEKASKEKADALGIDGFLMKPIVKSELSQTIRTVLDSKKAV